MKFRHYLETISGIDIYPMVSLFIFLTFFVGMAIWALKANKKYIDEVKNLPLD